MHKLLTILLLLAGVGLLAASWVTLHRHRRDAWQDAAQESARLLSVGAIADAVDSSSATLVLALNLYGENNVKTALSYEFLARTQFAAYNYTAAAINYERALASYNAVYGAEHPLALYTLTGLTDAFDELGDYAKAEHYAASAINSARAGGGEISPGAALVYAHIALLYADWGRLTESAQTARRAIEIASRSRAENAAAGLAKLALCETQTEQAPELAPDGEGHYCLEALSDINSAERPDSPLRARALLAASRANAAAKNIVQAAQQLDEASGLYARSPESNNRRTLSCAMALAEQKLHAGDFKIAGDTYDHNLPLFRETFGYNHNAVLHALADAGRVYTALGNFDMAQVVYRDALAAFDSTPGATPEQKIGLLRGLAALNAAQKNERDARQYLKLALEAAAPLDCSAAGNASAALYIDMVKLDLSSGKTKAAISDADLADAAIDKCMGYKHPLNLPHVRALLELRRAMTQPAPKE
jgi:hypothetical protein